MLLAPPFAVHIGPGLLNEAWVIGGFLFLTPLLTIALWRVGEREIPRIGVLTAAFFVASSVHIPLGGVSVHLLLNGLTGVILRWRAPLAIAVGLTLQTFLLSHGGPDALGVNFAVQVIPALLAGLTFRPLFRLMPAFVAGVIVGGGTAILTVVLHAVVLYLGVNVEDAEPRAWIAGVSLVAHLPVIVIEAVGVGFACRVLTKAKPEWLGVEENGPHPPSPSPEQRGGVQEGSADLVVAGSLRPADVGRSQAPGDDKVLGQDNHHQSEGVAGEVLPSIPLPAVGTEGKVDPSNG